MSDSSSESHYSLQIRFLNIVTLVANAIAISITAMSLRTIGYSETVHGRM
jgi:hypothetical protein